jgi:hypothetical protein
MSNRSRPQVRSHLPCDTDSDRALLEEAFQNLNFDRLEGNWFVAHPAGPRDEAGPRQKIDPKHVL